MTASLHFDQIRLPPECDELRHQVRAFLAEALELVTNATVRDVLDRAVEGWWERQAP